MRSDGQNETLAHRRASGPKRAGRGPDGPVACRMSVARKEMGHGPKVEIRGLGHMNSGQSFFSVFLFFTEAVFCCFLSNF